MTTMTATLPVYIGQVDMDCDGPSTRVFRVELPADRVRDFNLYGEHHPRKAEILWEMLREYVNSDAGPFASSIGDVSEWFPVDHDNDLPRFLARLDDRGRDYFKREGHSSINGNLWR